MLRPIHLLAQHPLLGHEGVTGEGLSRLVQVCNLISSAQLSGISYAVVLGRFIVTCDHLEDRKLLLDYEL